MAAEIWNGRRHGKIKSRMMEAELSMLCFFQGQGYRNDRSLYFYMSLMKTKPLRYEIRTLNEIAFTIISGGSSSVCLLSLNQNVEGCSFHLLCYFLASGLGRKESMFIVVVLA